MEPAEIEPATSRLQNRAQGSGRSAYDAAYIALATELGADLWTLDGPLARNAVSAGLPVRLVGTAQPAPAERDDAT